MHFFNLFFFLISVTNLQFALADRFESLSEGKRCTHNSECRRDEICVLTEAEYSTHQCISKRNLDACNVAPGTPKPNYCQNQKSFMARANCTCNGLASNYPGYSLFCNGQLIQRYSFDQFGIFLSKRVCEAHALINEGNTLPLPTTLCGCMESLSNQVNLVSDNRYPHDTVLLAFAYRNIPHGESRNDAINQCQSLFHEMEQARVCLEPKADLRNTRTFSKDI